MLSTRGLSPACSSRSLIAAVVRNSWLPQLRVHVQVATEGDEFGVQGLAQHAGEHIPGRPASDSRDINCFTL